MPGQWEAERELCDKPMMIACQATKELAAIVAAMRRSFQEDEQKEEEGEAKSGERRVSFAGDAAAGADDERPTASTGSPHDSQQEEEQDFDDGEGEESAPEPDRGPGRRVMVLAEWEVAPRKELVHAAPPEAVAAPSPCERGGFAAAAPGAAAAGAQPEQAAPSPRQWARGPSPPPTPGGWPALRPHRQLPSIVVHDRYTKREFALPPLVLPVKPAIGSPLQLSENSIEHIREVRRQRELVFSGQQVGLPLSARAGCPKSAAAGGGRDPCSPEAWRDRLAVFLRPPPLPAAPPAPASARPRGAGRRPVPP